MFTPQDLDDLKKRDITTGQVEQQLERFKTGFPYLKLDNAARPGNGIVVLDHDQEEKALDRWSRYLADGGTVSKFVPASGAASRMFKALFSFVDGNDDVPAAGSDVDKLLGDIHNIAFYNELNDKLVEIHGLTVDQLLEQGRYKDIIRGIIAEDGLNYGNLPKGLLSFHRYNDGAVRTPVEEQLVEGAQTATDANDVVKLHFTVSGNHRALFEEKVATAAPAIAQKLGVKFDISFSEQKPSTDTVAANEDNTPFREDGHLVFRPGGHGALIANLNDMTSAVVFVKNIDNVVPDTHRQATIRYKRVLAGYLIELHDHIAQHLELLAGGNYTRQQLLDIASWMQSSLSINHIDTTLGDHELAAFLAAKLNRPLRVAGMVKNEGEPGGGPYIAYNADGTSSPQILESTQINPGDATSTAMMKQATHFNPVDLVCYINDLQGNRYDLPAYVDHSTGFISSKSLHGKTLRALELPGLWNGAMSDWTTVFVEVPIETFNPVKTVNDLLRPTHQA